MTKMLRFSRPAGSPKPFEFLHGTRSTISVVRKEVHLGVHKPTDHYAPAAQAFVPAEDLYDNRRPRKRNRGL